MTVWTERVCCPPQMFYPQETIVMVLSLDLTSQEWGESCMSSLLTWFPPRPARKWRPRKMRALVLLERSHMALHAGIICVKPKFGISASLWSMVSNSWMFGRCSDLTVRNIWMEPQKESLMSSGPEADTLCSSGIGMPVASHSQVLSSGFPLLWQPLLCCAFFGTPPSSALPESSASIVCFPAICPAVLSGVFLYCRAVPCIFGFSGS